MVLVNHSDEAFRVGSTNEDRPTLHQILADAKRFRATGPDRDLARFKALVTEVRDKLAIYLLLEEFYRGADPWCIPPRLDSKDAAIHKRLEAAFQEVCDIADTAVEIEEMASPHQLRRLAERMRNAEDRLRQIDREETELIFDSFWQDLGVGD